MHPAAGAGGSPVGVTAADYGAQREHELSLPRSRDERGWYELRRRSDVEIATGAPTVVTGVASGVTDVSATLNGSVNPNGGSVSSCEVEYGTSPTLVGAAKASCGSPGSGSSPVAVSASGHRP